MTGTSPDPGEITNLILLQHMQAMKGELLRRMDGMDVRFDHIEVRLGRLEEDMTDVQSRVHSIDNALQRLYERRVQMIQRIDRLERKVDIR
jgi:predicted  nucleic acid-binding Zn-ribbon protein